MKTPENSQRRHDDKKMAAGDTHGLKKGKLRALELGEQAEHAIGPRREQLIRKARRESA